MMGIDTDRVIAITFFIGSALAGAAGVMFGLIYGQIFHLMGFLAGLKGFTAAVLGGIGSIPGAMVGGHLARPARGVRDRLPAAGVDLPRSLRVHPADRRHPDTAERHPRQGDGVQGMSEQWPPDPSDPERPARDKPRDRRRRVGREPRGPRRARRGHLAAGSAAGGGGRRRSAGSRSSSSRRSRSRSSATRATSTATG